MIIHWGIQEIRPIIERKTCYTGVRTPRTDPTGWFSGDGSTLLQPWCAQKFRQPRLIWQALKRSGPLLSQGSQLQASQLAAANCDSGTNTNPHDSSRCPNLVLTAVAEMRNWETHLYIAAPILRVCPMHLLKKTLLWQCHLKRFETSTNKLINQIGTGVGYGCWVRVLGTGGVRGQVGYRCWVRVLYHVAYPPYHINAPSFNIESLIMLWKTGGNSGWNSCYFSRYFGTVRYRYPTIVPITCTHTCTMHLYQVPIPSHTHAVPVRVPAPNTRTRAWLSFRPNLTDSRSQ